MMKKITAITSTITLLLSPAVALAADAKDAACTGLAYAGGTCADNGTALTNTFQTVANTLIFLVGAISVLMVIIGGLRYVLSNGDAAGLKSAKDTILYSLIGVVVALLSYALVSFVIGRFG